MPNLFVNGQHLILSGISGNVGDKNSVASIIIPVNVPDLVTAFAINPVDVASVLGISGLQCTDRPISQDPDGEYTVRFQFEGFNDNVSFETAQERMQLSWEPDMSEDPIQTHPRFLGENGIAARFFWNFQEEKFAKHRRADAGTNLDAKDIKTPPTNPFFGVENWLQARGIFKRSYAVTHVPQSIFRGIGTLIEYPPDAAKLDIPKFRRRRWLKLPPGVSQVGSAFRVEESYRLSGVTNGAEAIIYAAAQLSDE